MNENLVWNDKSIKWEQVEEEREDYLFFHQKQVGEEKEIIELARTRGYLESISSTC